MKWLQDNDSVTQEELEANAESADTAWAAADAYAYYAAADAAADAWSAAADAAADAWSAYAAYYATAERNVNRYFELTGEDKQTYLNNL
jgi:hypothetical protein